MCHCGNTGVERTPNKRQHIKLTLEKEILPHFLLGFELPTFDHESGALTNELSRLPFFVHAVTINLWLCEFLSLLVVVCYLHTIQHSSTSSFIIWPYSFINLSVHKRVNSFIYSFFFLHFETYCVPFPLSVVNSHMHFHVAVDNCFSQERSNQQPIRCDSVS